MPMPGGQLTGSSRDSRACRVSPLIRLWSLASRTRQGPFVGCSAAATRRDHNRGMYVPAHFRPDDEAVREVLRHPGAANLITATGEWLLATMLPLVWVERGSGPELGPTGALLGHVAR